MKKKTILLLIIFLFVLSSCSPAPEPTPTLISTSLPTASPTSSPTPTPIPAGYQKYQIELGVESSSPRVWMPSPRYWDGQSIKHIRYIQISPEPSDWYREENGTEIFYWENTSRRQQVYQITFEVEMVFIDNTTAADIKNQPYDNNSYLYKKYTKPSNNVQSDSQEIIDLAKSIVGEEMNPFQRAKLVQEWLEKNITYIPGDRDALSVLQNGGSDCAGRAHLYVALLRASGIPARNVSGIHSPGSGHLKSGVWYPDKTMGYHVWVEFYIEGYGWIQIEPSQHGGFGKLEEHRIVTSKGNDLLISNNFPNKNISWFHLPYDIHSQIENDPLWFNVSKIE